MGGREDEKEGGFVLKVNSIDGLRRAA